MIKGIVIIKDGINFFYRRFEPPREDENLIETEALIVSLLKGISTFLVQTTGNEYSELTFKDGTRVVRSTTRQHGQIFTSYILLRQLGYLEFHAIQKIAKLIEDYAYMGQIYSRIIDPSNLIVEPIVIKDLDEIVKEVNGSLPDLSEYMY